MSPLAVSNKTEQQVTLVRLQNGTCIPIYLWRRSISFLTVREQAVSVRGISCFLRKCSDEYMKNFWLKPTVCLPQDASSLARAMEMCQYLMEQEGYVEGTTMVVELGSGVHKVVGSCDVPGVWGTFRYQKTLSIPFDNLSFVGKGERETIVHGSFVVENGRKISFTSLTVKNPSGLGLGAYGAGTEMVLQNVTVENCQNSGVWAQEGAKIVATECQSRQNGGCGVNMRGSTTIAHFTNFTSYHNKRSGVVAVEGAVVDLMGEGTSVHRNTGCGLYANSPGTTINVYQPCVLNDMSHGNKRQNICMDQGGIVRQRDSKKYALQ